MAENSVFAILLRSPWWTSAAVAGAIVLVSRLALPSGWFAYGAFSAVPFAAIACIAAWRQLQVPSAGRVAATLDAVRAMPWSAFSQAVEEAFRRDGFAVTRLGGPAVDFEMVKLGRTALLSCKRWKTARTGVEPLRDLIAAKDARDAHDCMYIATGEITDKARAFAAERRIRLIDGADLVKLLPGVARR
jgi:restriction system protein